MHFCRSHRARRFGRAANLEVGFVTGVPVSVGLGDRLQRPHPLRIGECPTCPLVEACIRGQTDQRSQSRMGGWKKSAASLWIFTICQPCDLGDTSSATLVFDGPLLQKASYPILAVPSGTFEFSVQMASQLPSDWVGSIQNETILDYYSPSENLHRTFLQFIQESFIQSETRNCHGSCIGKILAPGIVYVDCKRARRDVNIHNLLQ